MKKLIEVALPLDAINVESAREKSIRHGHPSTLHLWWARRPLAACRAVLFAQLVDDPSSLPEEFPTEELQDAERQRLFGIIEELVKWENTTNEEVLEAAREEIRRSCGGNPPPVLDPFAGGGSIPLEAQRLGLEAHASDLNPVAVLINKALIEIPPKFAGQAPVHPDAENRTRWNGAEGLAEDVRRYGQWMRDEAERRIGHLYPKATMPDGSEATVIAWIWARTVTCPNPACGATMPLVRSFWLGKKKGKEAWVKPVVEGKTVRFEIGHGSGGPVVEGTVGRSGAQCTVCGEAVKLEYIREQGRAGRMGQDLMALAAEGDRRRVYLPPSDLHRLAAEVLKPASYPRGELFDWPGRINVVRYGLTEFHQLFTNRQLMALLTFSDLVGGARERVEADAVAVCDPAENASTYADAVATYLGLCASKMAAFHSTQSRWRPDADKTAPAFGRQAIPMVWDFAELMPFAGAGGDWEGVVKGACDALAKLRPAAAGSATQVDARVAGSSGQLVATDPPYYDNIGYADLADYFYVWLRTTLSSIHPDLFGTILTPKSAELIANPHRHDGSKNQAEDYFEAGFVDVFETARRIAPSDAPMTLFYAFKQSEDAGADGVASTGWSTMLEGLQAAGWMVTATWPMRTELATKLNMGSNLLASSVVLACRPRPKSAGITDRQGLLRALREELPGPIRELQKAAIAPVDLRQAAIGPGMAVFSRFAKVVEPDGEPMRVRTALGLINQVLETVLGELEADLDPETRWAIQWFSQFFEDEGPFGTAESLAVSMNVSVDGLVSSGILESGGGKARLLSRGELSDGWDPATDDRVPVWEATQHLIRRLESDGEVSAARLFRQLGGMADSCKALAYRLYDVCESSRPNLAGPYNMLAASWPEIQRLAAQTTAPVQTAEEQQLDL